MPVCEGAFLAASLNRLYSPWRSRLLEVDTSRSPLFGIMFNDDPAAAEEYLESIVPDASPSPALFVLELFVEFTPAGDDEDPAELPAWEEVKIAPRPLTDLEWAKLRQRGRLWESEAHTT